MKSKNRCLALSPGLHWRCQKRRGHIQTPTDLHRVEFTKWTDVEGTSVVLDETKRFYEDRPMESVIFSTTNADSNFIPTNAIHVQIAELRGWWLGQARAEMEPTIDKAVEYGSTDLIDIGLMLARTMRREVTEEEAAELGVFFYLIGKIARWQSAIERGDRPSEDTLLDIGVYVRMAQRIRDAGGWPGTKEKVE